MQNYPGYLNKVEKTIQNVNIRFGKFNKIVQGKL
jgi:hypothetical protein